MLWLTLPGNQGEESSESNSKFSYNYIEIPYTPDNIVSLCLTSNFDSIFNFFVGAICKWRFTIKVFYILKKEKCRQQTSLIRAPTISASRTSSEPVASSLIPRTSPCDSSPMQHSQFDHMNDTPPSVVQDGVVHTSRQTKWAVSKARGEWFYITELIF